MASLNNEAAASSSSSSLPLSPTDHQKHYTYEVFLSFRGEDTRSSFTDHLYTALRDRGIETFRDDDELRRGEEISKALLKAIEESRVAVIVFSQNYASSSWCLDELVKILECRKSGQEVIPIFYKVDPSHVRHQKGTFADALNKLEGRYKDRVGKWREALSDAANLSGWPYEEDRSEAEFIKMIVGDLSARVVNSSYDLDVAKYPIELESCRRDVNSLLKVEENIVRMVGIWGPGGIGKTTIAKDVFNSIRHKFECCCFLTDVRSRDLAQLQETLLSDILKLNPTLKVRSVDQGISFIKTMMRHKKVILLLDDVSDSSQLEKLVPFRDCFGLGSKILITTRDKRCLTAHQVDEVYEVKMLADDQALKLFSLNAFRENGPPSDYLELAQCAVHYAQGLPLALIILGSHLFRRTIEEWKATIGSCKGGATIGSCKGGPQADVQKVLKLSYDALEKDLKELFLDIACFFQGKSAARVKSILKACYGHKTMVIGIAQLQEKALIRIDRGDKIWMHDLIEELGKDVVFQESPDEPGERSRVWNAEDVNDVLTNNKGTNKVVGIQAPRGCSSISLNAKSFSGMKKLRYISMSYGSFSGDIDYLPNQLRWLDWQACPLQCFPSNFQANELVNLDISRSHKITRLWKGRKNFLRLTCMDLRDCKSLKELPDFSGIPNLKELDLSWCTGLVKVPDSIRFPHNLVTLNVDRCYNLIMFPRKINLKYVEKISISYCKLEEFSEVGEEMGSLRSLVLGRTCIKELHPSITKLNGLEQLELWDCKNLTTLPYNIYELKNLKTLNASGCSKLATFPKIPVKMNSLRRVSLKGSDIRELDESIVNLIGLEELNLRYCENLTILPCSIYKLHNLKLDVRGCSKLATFPKILVKMDSLRRVSLKGSDIRELDESIKNLIGLEDLVLTDCKNLTTLPCSIYGLHNLKTLEAIGCSKLVTFPKVLEKMGSLRRLSLEGSDIRELDESIENLIGLEDLVLTDCKNLTTLPCSIYGLQNLNCFELINCSKLVRFPTNNKILNVDGYSLSLPKLRLFSIAGCSLLSNCDFLMTLDCWETLQGLNLSRNNFVSLPACLTKFVKLFWVGLEDCKRLRGIPELPPSVVVLDITGCELLEERFSKLTNRGAVIEEASPSTEDDDEEEPTPSSCCLCLPKL